MAWPPAHGSVGAVTLIPEMEGGRGAMEGGTETANGPTPSPTRNTGLLQLARTKYSARASRPPSGSTRVASWPRGCAKAMTTLPDTPGTPGSRHTVAPTLLLVPAVPAPDNGAGVTMVKPAAGPSVALTASAGASDQAPTGGPGRSPKLELLLHCTRNWVTGKGGGDSGTRRPTRRDVKESWSRLVRGAAPLAKVGEVDGGMGGVGTESQPRGRPGRGSQTSLRVCTCKHKCK